MSAFQLVIFQLRLFAKTLLIKLSCLWLIYKWKIFLSLGIKKWVLFSLRIILNCWFVLGVVFPDLCQNSVLSASLCQTACRCCCCFEQKGLKIIVSGPAADLQIQPTATIIVPHFSDISFQSWQIDFVSIIGFYGNFNFHIKLLQNKVK